jgi:hypothetical protein
MNPWKLATFGIVGVLVTSLTTGLTTAFLMRQPAQAETVAPVTAPSGVRYAAATQTQPRTVVTRSAPSAAVRPVSTAAAAPAECATTGDRVWRIAKPGLIGTLLGAGAGAAGGAIADGGKAAGKGALIGGLAGAALGSAYGAYKTKNECGTILGGSGFGPAPAQGDRVFAYTAPSSAPSPSGTAAPAAVPTASGDRITVYDAGRSLPR